MVDEFPNTTAVEVVPSGVYTHEPWRLVAPFGSAHKTLIKTYDPRIYPHNESITVAAVDPASEVPVEIAEANARRIVTAVNSYDALREAAKAALEAFRYMRDVDPRHWDIHVTPEICTAWDKLRAIVNPKD